MRRVLILQAGSAAPELVSRFGDYPAWFARLLGSSVELRVVRADEPRLPAPTRFHGVLMTGSPRSVTAPEPWMPRAAAYLLEAARYLPVLGVCFGHQLLAQALGGRVERNPRGREAGTAPVRLTAAGLADPLFAGLPPVLEVQHTHADHVALLPRAAEVLAANDFTPIQAFAAGDLLRCVQFHPELDAARSQRLNEGRRQLLDREAPGGAAAVLSSIRPTPDGATVLRNWVHRFVGAPLRTGEASTGERWR